VIRLALRVRREQAEIALADLLELAPSGVEEIELDGETLEYAVYGAPGELPELPALRASVGGALIEVSSSEVAEDWHERWKLFHRPVTLPAPARGGVPALHLRPPWEPPLADEQTQEIVIDPGQAFGTGSHATTKLCLALLLELASLGASGPAIDVGTGSGVLAIAAAKLGFEPITAFDHDPESIRAAAENARANGVKLDLARIDLRRDSLPSMSGVVALANLLAPLLLELAERMPRAPEHLILSGLLVGEVDEICDAFVARHGMAERSRLHQGEWAAAWLSCEAQR
jgi:ribosomal protein L11 methyltransferase